MGLQVTSYKLGMSGALKIVGWAVPNASLTKETTVPERSDALSAKRGMYGIYLVCILMIWIVHLIVFISCLISFIYL